MQPTRLEDCLRCMNGMISTMRVNEERMRQGSLGGFMAATDLADYLVGKGVPFRHAHEIVGELVLACEKEGRTLQSLTAQDLRAHSDYFGEDALESVDIDAVVSKRITEGGTGHSAVEVQLEKAETLYDLDAEQLSRF